MQDDELHKATNFNYKEKEVLSKIFFIFKKTLAMAYIMYIYVCYFVSFQDMKSKHAIKTIIQKQR
jgi:hypothetical protein